MKRITFFTLMFLSVSVFCLTSISEVAPEDEGMPAVKVLTWRIHVWPDPHPFRISGRPWSQTFEFPGTVVSAEGTWESSGFIPISDSDFPYIVSRNRIKGRGNTITIGGLRPGGRRLGGVRVLVTGTVKYLAEPPQLKADVNTDNTVNIQDLIFISRNFGELRQTSSISRDPIKRIGKFTWKLERHSADVNWDGVVNILDLVLVAGAFEAAAAAPSLHTQTLQTLNASEVQQWLLRAQQLNPKDVRSQRGIAVLDGFLAALRTPKKTALLPNYPNPFNPETWIPYHLAEPADVTLRIYSADGKLVRTLALGHQPAGLYESKSRAAYWDGRNSVGERVASGLYFYTLTAGDFAATGKMLIMK